MNMSERAPEEYLSADQSPEQFIASIEEQIAIADLRIAEVIANHPEDIHEVVDEIITELDEMWPYHGHTFLVAGQWTIGKEKYKAEKQSFKFYEKKEDVLQPATSQGFTVDVNNDTEKVQVHFSFIATQFEVRLPKVQLGGVTLANALPAEVTLSYIDQDISEEEVRSFPVQLLQKAELSEALHGLYLNHSNFFSLSQKKQQKLMDNLIDDINTGLINSPLEISVEAQVSKAYAHDQNSVSELQEITPAEGEKNLTIYGNIASVALFNSSVYDRQHVSHKDQLIDGEAGLCYEIVDLGPLSSERVRQNSITRVAFKDISKLSISPYI